MKNSKFFDLWPCDVDLFSASWNAQLESFVSFNAFSLNWSKYSGYLFPPFSLILKCVDKIKRDIANVVFICPVWTTQPWFPVLLEMAADIPYLLPQTSNLLSSPMSKPHPLIVNNSLRLAVWRLSGDVLSCRDFRARLSTSCWPAIVRIPDQRMNRHGVSGTIGVFEGVSIPYRLLSPSC